MPFTFSHPAIILPFTFLPKKWFSLTGLIIGSLVPDFEYFLRMKIKSEYSHTLQGVFWFDLPLAILLAFCFHLVVKNQLIHNLPSFLRSRFLRCLDFKWNQYFKEKWLIVILSILIGIFSHLLWDSFTHDTGFFVESIPFLSKSVFILGVDVPILKILQHASTLIGGILILAFIYKLPWFEVENTKVNSNYWIIFALIASAVFILRFYYGLNLKQYGNILVSLISACLFSLIMTSCLFNFKKRN